MKNLKFRIYDNDKKGFHYLTSIFNMPDPSYDGEVEQWTGLFDKFGKEIYEGDLVVKIGYKYNEKTKKHDIPIKNKFIQKVCWGDITETQNEQGGNSYDNYEGWVAQDLDCEINNSINNVEVIGNIYENPELLK